MEDADDLKVPYCTLVLVSLGLAASLLPQGAQLLEYDRVAMADGAIWRSLSGQLVHWTLRMTVLDLVAVLVLGSWLERDSRSLAMLTILLAAVTCGAGVHFLSDVSRYRGASGIASALFVVAALRMGDSACPRPLRLVSAFALTLFAVKIALEVLTGRAIAAGHLLPGVEVLPAVHLLGALAGLAAWGAWRSMLEGRRSDGRRRRAAAER